MHCVRQQTVRKLIVERCGLDLVRMWREDKLHFRSAWFDSARRKLSGWRPTTKHTRESAASVSGVLE